MANRILSRLKVLCILVKRWLRDVCYVLLYFFRRNQKIVVATAFSGKKFGDSPRYIVERIHELSPDTKIVWLSNRETNEIFPPYIRVVDFSNKKNRFLAVTNASILIGNNLCFSSYPHFNSQLRIETWHGGLGIKKIGLDSAFYKNRKKSQPRRHSDFYISNSDHLTKIYRTAFLYTGPVWKCGYPIEDELRVDNGERELYHKLYNIPSDTRVIVYAPTFKSVYDWKPTISVSSVVESFEKRFGGKWVMVVHWHQNMRKEDRILDGVIDVTGVSNMEDLVKFADAFISDYSSSIFQAVQRDIPCFIYADDYQQYKDDRDIVYSWDEFPFPYAFTNSELIENIRCYDKAIWDEKWKCFAERMGHVVTGHSAYDIAKICVDFINGKSKQEIMNEIPFETQY